MNKKIHICNLVIITFIVSGIVLMVYGVKGINSFGKVSLAWQDMSRVSNRYGDCSPYQMTFKSQESYINPIKFGTSQLCIISAYVAAAMLLQIFKYKSDNLVISCCSMTVFGFFLVLLLGAVQDRYNMCSSVYTWSYCNRFYI